MKVEKCSTTKPKTEPALFYEEILGKEGIYKPLGDFRSGTRLIVISDDKSSPLLFFRDSMLEFATNWEDYKFVKTDETNLF